MAHAGERSQSKSNKRGLVWFLKGFLFDLVKPKGHRMLVLGAACAVGGLAGAVLTMVESGGILKSLAQLAVGVIGLYITVACVVEYSKRR
ncbi:hypothetical protein ACFC0M_06615 [Streptomyces sp. NPDC056149]|uniref:hypothetical protein n=1 Tax=Streptomyces sp. NPDC056149 TaxID=3345728 RepID=UPI0035DD79AB